MSNKDTNASAFANYVTNKVPLHHFEFILGPYLARSNIETVN